MGKDCTQSGCPGCRWECKCNLSCRRCQQADKTPCYYGYLDSNNNCNIRDKYVCFKCKNIFKGKFTPKMKQDLPKRSRYIFEGARCNKCSNEVFAVGETFRHCKSEKEWDELELKFKNRERDMIKYFSYCPFDRDNRRNSKKRIKWNDTRKKNDSNIQIVNPDPYRIRSFMP